MIVTVTGGAASGKSAIAERLAVGLGSGRLGYLATMRVCDAESESRVKRHRRMRTGKGFGTVECPCGLPEEGTLRRFDTVLLEDMPNWMANGLFSSGTDMPETVRGILRDTRRLYGTVRNAVIVTGEVFSAGTQGYDPFTRAYIGALGAVNCALAAMSDIVIESVCGIPVFQKGKEAARIYENIL